MLRLAPRRGTCRERVEAMTSGDDAAFLFIMNIQVRPYHIQQTQDEGRHATSRQREIVSVLCSLKFRVSIFHLRPNYLS